MPQEAHEIDTRKLPFSTSKKKKSKDSRVLVLGVLVLGILLRALGVLGFLLLGCGEWQFSTSSVSSSFRSRHINISFKLSLIDPLRRLNVYLYAAIFNEEHTLDVGYSRIIFMSF
jgi:hypothetical protein